MHAVILRATQRRWIGQGVGARDVQMVLERDEFRRFVGSEQPVESDVGCYARRALRAGKQFEQRDTVSLAVTATRKRHRLKWRHLFVIFDVEFLFELGRTLGE